jgi:uncharacterized protein HemX
LAKYRTETYNYLTNLCAAEGLDLGALSCAALSNSTSTTSSLPTTSLTSSPSKNSTVTTPISTNSGNGGLPDKAKAGIAVGAIAAVVILAMIGWIMLKRRRKNQENNGEQADAKVEPYEKAELPADSEAKIMSPIEMAALNNPPQELDSRPVIHELHNSPNEHA